MGFLFIYLFGFKSVAYNVGISLWLPFKDTQTDMIKLKYAQPTLV